MPAELFCVLRGVCFTSVMSDGVVTGYIKALR